MLQLSGLLGYARGLKGLVLDALICNEVGSGRKVEGTDLDPDPALHDLVCNEIGNTWWVQQGRHSSEGHEFRFKPLRALIYTRVLCRRISSATR